MTTETVAALTDTEIGLMDAYWRAANYLSVGQIYLLENALLREPLRPEHIKPRLLGHWGTTPGLNLVYTHMNRLIRGARPERDLHHRSGARRPRGGGPTYLEGTYGECYHHIDHNEDGMCPLFRAVLVPGRHPQPRRGRDSPAPSTRAASWATRWCTRTAPRSTTRTCWSAA